MFTLYNIITILFYVILYLQLVCIMSKIFDCLCLIGKFICKEIIHSVSLTIELILLHVYRLTTKINLFQKEIQKQNTKCTCNCANKLS